MYQIKFLFLSLLIFTNLNAKDDVENLYKKAKELESSGNYKEAMLIYKDIALEQSKINRIYVDEDKQKELETINQTINSIEDKETTRTLQQILSSTFSIYPHHENFILPFSHDTKKKDDRKQTEAKIQLSVKKPIAHNLFGFNETINLGYTHTSLWQLYEDSSPFRETSYKPEIFVNIPYGKRDKTALKGFSLGLLHESNGQPQETSRSWNRFYLESYFQAGNLFLIPKVWYRLPEKKEDDDNPDLEDYMGYGDLTLVYPYKSHTFKLLLRNNLKLDDDNKGFAQLDWSFPLFSSKNSFGYLQLSNGYGDSLIDYDKEISRISFGITLSR